MRDKPLLAIGGALVVNYVLLRTITIGYADERLIGIDLEKIPALWLLEVGGLAVFTSGLSQTHLVGIESSAVSQVSRQQT